MGVTLDLSHRFGVSWNRVLRGIFGTKSGKIPGDWRRLHNEELRNLYASPTTIREII
jgi:hypothetical protein